MVSQQWRKKVVFGSTGAPALTSAGGGRRQRGCVPHNLRRLAALLLCLGLAGAGPAALAQEQEQPAPAQPAGTEERIGDWMLRCLPPSNGAPERCEMAQVLGDTQSNRDVLLMAIGYPEPGGKPVAWVVLPLGVLLPPGIGLKIDQGESRVLPFRACDQRGCAAPWPLTEADVAALKGGNELMVVFRNLEGKSLGVAVSLQGFTKAFARLK